ncbi:MAG: energy transducer TonB [Ignavibacteriae bacterium]|nr:energy transducer TonB [Ignavibacteriota bacterium]
MKRAKAIALPHPFPYGATELKELSERFTFKAFGYALGLITAVSIIIALLMSFAKEIRIEIPKIAGGYELIELGNNNKEVKVQLYKNYSRVPADFGFKEIAGNPEPTPISELTRNPGTFADFGNLGKVLSTEGTKEIHEDNVAHVLGNSNEPVKDIELSPEDFVAVEVEPYIDLSELQRRVAYSEMARRAGVEGKVIVRVLVGKDGKPVKSIIEFSDNELLNESAAKAVMNSIFNPARQNGNPVALWVSIPINFRLR